MYVAEYHIGVSLTLKNQGLYDLLPMYKHYQAFINNTKLFTHTTLEKLAEKMRGPKVLKDFTRRNPESLRQKDRAGTWVTPLFS